MKGPGYEAAIVGQKFDVSNCLIIMYVLVY